MESLDVWQIWIIAAFATIIIEVFTPGFLIACFTLGCLLASAAAGLDYSINMQWIVFSVATIFSFFALRPIALKYAYNNKKVVRTNSDSLVGMNCIVYETITSATGKGTVKVYGDIWSAECSTDIDLEPGTKLKITQVDSNVLTVTPL